MSTKIFCIKSEKDLMEALLSSKDSSLRALLFREMESLIGKNIDLKFFPHFLIRAIGKILNEEIDDFKGRNVRIFLTEEIPEIISKLVPNQELSQKIIREAFKINP